MKRAATGTRNVALAVLALAGATAGCGKRPALPPVDAAEDGVSAAPGSARATPDGLCPRCGGRGVPPRRQHSNPFLMETEPLVCADCGLDFEQPIGRKAPETLPPWGS